MKVTTPAYLEGKWEIDGKWIDPKLLMEGRKEEIQYMRKIGVVEVVDEKECYDNGCKPLKLKWVDKMKGEKCRLRLVCRRSKGPRTETNNLDQKTYFHPAAVGKIEDACGHNDDRTRRWKSCRRSI